MNYNIEELNTTEYVNNTDELLASDSDDSLDLQDTLDANRGNEIIKIYNLNKLDYDYKTNTNDYSKPSPYKEIIRFHNINGLNNYFQLKLKELDKNIYNTNELFKNNSCKLLELINRWCWHQYNNPTCIDFVIPYLKDNNYDYMRFIDDLNYILGVHDTIDAIKITDKIICELRDSIRDYLHIEYLNYSSRDNIDIPVVKDFIDKKVRLSCTYKNNSYPVIMHSKVYDRLKYKLIMFGKEYNIIGEYMNNIDNLLDQYIYCLFFRYSYMDSGNQQLAINQYIKDMFKKSGVNFELFGSAINSVSTNYCSLFFDIEKYFGSKGNFFDIEINKGVYWCNPPYDDTIMTNTGDKLLSILNTDKQVVFVITVPIWDTYTQNKMKEDKIEKICRNYNKDTKDDVHSDFKIYQKLKPYIKDELIIPKHRIPYFNYKKYSYINAVNTYMLIVYNNIPADIAENLSANFDQIMKLDLNNHFY